MADSLRPHRLQHTRLPCPSLSPRVCSNSCPMSWWCYPTISSSAAPFSCPYSFPAPGSFPVDWFFASGGQSIGSSTSVSVLKWTFRLISFRIDWFDLFAVQGNLKSLLQHHNSKTLVLQCLSFFIVQLSHPYITIGKTMALTIRIFVGQVISLFFNVLSRFVTAFLPRSKHLVISCLQSSSPEILEPPKRKSVTGSTFSLYLCHEVIGLDTIILGLWMLF